MKKTSKITALALASLMVLTACGGGSKKSENGKNDGGKEVKESGFKVEPTVQNEGNPIQGGTLKVGLVSASPFKGIFHEAFVQDGIDMTIMNWTLNGFFDSDPDFKNGDTGAGKIEYKPEEKKAIVTIKDEVKWSDGVPITSKDFLRYYLIVGHKDYTGVRYGTDYRNVVGMDEYHDGKSEEISGVKILSDKQFEVTFKEFDHSIYWGKGIPFNPVPDHIYKDIPVAEQEAHDATRKNPLGFGPFIIKSIVPGQQVVAEANPNFWAGKPKVDRIEIKVVSPEQVVAASKAGEFDIIDGFNTDLFSKFKELTNGKIATNHAGNYGYLAFKLGKWDNDKNEVVTNPDAKMADKELRKAMAKAIDRDTINSKLLSDLSIPLYQIIPPVFTTIYDKQFEGHRFNVDEAKKILDAAGYKDTNGDGMREDKKGQPLKISFAAMSGSATQEPTIQFYIKSWKDIGLDVQLYSGRLMETNAFYDKVIADDPEIDLYQGFWNTGSNPDPTGFYGKYEAFNMLRFASPELDKHLANIVTMDNTDPNVRLQHYVELSKYMVTDEAVVIPLFAGTKKVFVNNRVKKYDISNAEKDKAPFRTSEIELTKDAPEVGK